MHKEKKKQSNSVSPKGWKDKSCRGRWKREKVNGPSIFITKIFQILENDSYSNLVAWNYQGTYFTIFDVGLFEQEILPAYFRHKNFSSFVRQLNMYDFHKIRNEQNKSIFQHRQFRRDAQHLLKNIKRKGCSKKLTDLISGVSEEQESASANYEETYEKNETQRLTEAVIEKKSQVDLPKPKENPFKIQLLQDFISSLPSIVQSEQQVRQIIKEMKKDSKYRCLSSKQDVRQVVHKIRNSRMKKQIDDGFEELSIEEQIMVENVDDRQHRLPTLAVVSSDNYLPLRTQNLICSLILCDDAALPKQN